MKVIKLNEVKQESIYHYSDRNRINSIQVEFSDSEDVERLNRINKLLTSMITEEYKRRVT